MCIRPHLTRDGRSCRAGPKAAVKVRMEVSVAAAKEGFADSFAAVSAVHALVERFDIEPFPDFSAK